MLTESGINSIQSQRSKKDHVIELIKKDYELSLLSVLPGFESKLFEIKRIATRLHIEPQVRDDFIDLLFDSGLWTLKDNKKEVVCDFDLLDMGDISISDFLSMTVSIITRLKHDPPGEYETLTLVTSKDLVKTFLKSINRSLKELYLSSQSEGLQKDCVFSWTHTGMLEYEFKKQKDDKLEE